MYDFEVGNRIKYYRQKYGFSQTTIAKLIGVSKNAISLYEQGKMIPSIKKALALERVLQTPLNELFYRLYVDDDLPVATPFSPQINCDECMYYLLNGHCPFKVECRYEPIDDLPF